MRSYLEPYGAKFQPKSEGRVHYSIPIKVPVNRDKLYHYFISHDTPVNTIWANPWSKTKLGGQFGDTYPNTKTVADSILVFNIDAMNQEDVLCACEQYKTFVEEFGID